MSCHDPQIIKQIASREELILAAEQVFPDPVLYLPYTNRTESDPGKNIVPLVVCISGGEPMHAEAEVLRRAGYAVYACYASQIGLERDASALQMWMQKLEEDLDRRFEQYQCLDASALYIDGWPAFSVITRTKRFRAAIQRPALINLSTAFGTCTAGWMIPDGRPLEIRMYEAAEQSVLTRIDDCATPCLIVYDEGNLRYAREQSEQLYAAMKDRNPQIPCRMAVFTKAQWENCLMQEILQWLRRFPKPEEQEDLMGVADA